MSKKRTVPARDIILMDIWCGLTERWPPEILNTAYDPMMHGRKWNVIQEHPRGCITIVYAKWLGEGVCKAGRVCGVDDVDLIPASLRPPPVALAMWRIESGNSGCFWIGGASPAVLADIPIWIKPPSRKVLGGAGFYFKPQEG